jgi:hypothetical protein
MPVILNNTAGRDSAVRIVILYVLDGPGVESRWGARFSAPVQTVPAPLPHPIQWVPGLSRG